MRSLSAFQAEEIFEYIVMYRMTFFWYTMPSIHPNKHNTRFSPLSQFNRAAGKCDVRGSTLRKDLIYLNVKSFYARNPAYRRHLTTAHEKV